MPSGWNETDSWNFANHRGIDLGGGAKLICVAIGYPVTAAGTGDELDSKIIWDDPTGQKDVYIGKDENPKSIVLLLDYGGFQETLGGDQTDEVELALGAALTDPAFGLNEIDVYKVHHHGSASASASTFLASIRPEISVCSVGSHGSYEHPRRESYERLHQAGSYIYQTNEGYEGPGSYAEPPAGWGVLVNGPITIVATKWTYGVTRDPEGNLDVYLVDDKAWRNRIRRPLRRVAP